MKPAEALCGSNNLVFTNQSEWLLPISYDPAVVTVKMCTKCLGQVVECQAQRSQISVSFFSWQNPASSLLQPPGTVQNRQILLFLGSRPGIPIANRDRAQVINLGTCIQTSSCKPAATSGTATRKARPERRLPHVGTLVAQSLLATSRKLCSNSMVCERGNQRGNSSSADQRLL